jgi:hypothetical protein
MRGPRFAHLGHRVANEHDAAVFDEQLVHQRERDRQDTRHHHAIDLLEVH